MSTLVQNQTFRISIPRWHIFLSLPFNYLFKYFPIKRMCKFHCFSQYNSIITRGLLFSFLLDPFHFSSTWVTIHHCLPKNRSFSPACLNLPILFFCQGSLIVTRLTDPKSSKTGSLPSIPLSLGGASLSCLAAEHHQIHNEESLDQWRTKALQTVDDLCEEKASHLRHEAHLNVLLGQIRALIDEEKPRRASAYFLDDQPSMPKTPNSYRQ